MEFPTTIIAIINSLSHPPAHKLAHQLAPMVGVLISAAITSPAGSIFPFTFLNVDLR